MKDKFYNYLHTIFRNNIPLSERTITRYVSAIEVNSSLIEYNFYAAKSLNELEQNKNTLFNNKEFMQKDSTGNRMYSAALNHYLQFYKTNIIDTSFPDISFRKEVNFSAIKNGIVIPSKYHDMFLTDKFLNIKNGESFDISLRVNNNIFPAKIYNFVSLMINGKDTHVPLEDIANLNNEDISELRHRIQIRYSKAIFEYLSKIYHSTYNYILEQKQQTKKQHVNIPNSLKEYIYISSTSDNTIFQVETFIKEDNSKLINEISNHTELEIENFFNRIDESATIKTKQSIVKYRRLNTKIINELKELYDYRCQICGERTREIYGFDLVHAHHIDYFSNSQNNNANNIVILCPNHHLRIHTGNPVFNRKKLEFIYSNGYKEKILFNKHL